MALLLTRDVLRCSVFDAQEKCLRPDVFIRLIGVEQYQKTGAVHFMYDKLQHERNLDLPSTPQVPINHPQRLIELYQSMKANGYQHKWPIWLDRNGKLVEVRTG